ncbi:adenosylcobinamide amidohydrolase [Actinopolyspora saharensis]|uniref:Adenosylcobinamide amidohydrolase n=1 Tax=Actinopolyspora saharensis TaxID=995062 RepID=A0A1H1ED14_9ACTN|nr:adenosylcobinamide amidohydrolase [Actinopolyspora saharensis]SDQ86645.1 Adenosylcobinamide amidohydrolase [Actinopolyspora saharensis]
MTPAEWTSLPEAVVRTVRGGPLLLWEFRRPWLAVSSAVHGGGLGLRHWVVNATVPSGYDRSDPELHVAELAEELELSGQGSGLLTAVDVGHAATATDSGVRASVTTGVGHPVWAAHEGARTEHLVRHAPGTINAVCFSPVRLEESALVNLVATVAEAKAQALVEAGVPGTGTCTDATVVACPVDGAAEPYGGPRSVVGAPLARAVHSAVTAGLRVRDPRDR